MKKVLLTLSLFGTLLFTGCSKKNVTKEKWESHVETDGLFKYEYIYEDDSRTIICSAKKNSTSEYEEYYKYYTLFDEDKYILEDIEYVWSTEDDEWVGEIKKVNTYSDDHKKNHQVIYEYSEDSDYFNWIWREEGQMDYEYKTIKGKDYVTVEIEYLGNVIWEKYEYSYDSKGNLKSYNEYSLNWTTKELEFYRTAKIEVKGNKETHNFYYANNDSVCTYKEEYEFDEKNNQISESNYRNVDGTWTLISKSTDEYVNGKHMSHTDYWYEDGVEEINYKDEYEYLDDGYIQTTAYDGDDGELKPFCKYKYLLDKFGNEVFLTYM
ncbi:MAG: hypothetical protein J6Y28_02195 [Acholeplasmatales bacterium]|nr:hypothetical protein [Acholeplasmatales bacterium]